LTYQQPLNIERNKMNKQELAEAKLSVLWQQQQLAMDNIENATTDEDCKAWQLELARINRALAKARS
jgi:hypothetical protein